MFEVHVEYEIDDHWERTDGLIGLIVLAAGRSCGAFAVGVSTRTRYMVWTVGTFDEAVGLRKRVSLVAGVKATLREV